MEWGWKGQAPAFTISVSQYLKKKGPSTKRASNKKEPGKLRRDSGGALSNATPSFKMKSGGRQAKSSSYMFPRTSARHT